MNSEANSSTDKLCKLCNEEDAKYCCPRCGIPYCSSKCYKSEAHTNCSESFYKECVVSEIAGRDLDPESKRNMMEILQRIQQTDTQFDDEELDSDDESDIDLSERLKGIDLDDADSIWKRLTDGERQEFEELLRNGDVSKIIPLWEPWWHHRVEKKMVEEVGASTYDSFKKRCPSLKANIPPFSSISKLTPSSSVRWNVANVVAAYIVVAITYNGEHQSDPMEGSALMLNLSTNISSNQNFEDLELAVESVVQESINKQICIGKVDSIQLKEDLTKLFSGPSESEHNFYVLAALSDLHKMFTVAKQKQTGSTKREATDFSRRFPESSLPPVPKGKLLNSIKKMEYFLSWVMEFY